METSSASSAAMGPASRRCSRFSVASRNRRRAPPLSKGRVGSLLEVGTGFHMELTGRENVFLNGAILGMGRHEIRRQFDEIVAFAEVEDFIDMPVKRYSSGMFVRLAFAVAAHLETEIIIIDEVLSVGDTGFQKKCLQKVGSLARGGRTVLFVSHNLATVQNLCQKAVFLNRGRVECIGSCADVLNAYMRTMSNTSSADSSLAAFRTEESLPVIQQVFLRNRWRRIQGTFQRRATDDRDRIRFAQGFERTAFRDHVRVDDRGKVVQSANLGPVWDDLGLAAPWNGDLSLA